MNFPHDSPSLFSHFPALLKLWILIQSGNILNSHTDLIEFPLQFPCNGRSNLWPFYFYWRNHIDMSSIQWFIYYFSTSYNKKVFWWKRKKFLRLERIYCEKYCYCLVTNLIEMLEVNDDVQKMEKNLITFLIVFWVLDVKPY